MMSHIPKWFKIHELVPPDVYYRRGNDAWELLDDRLLVLLDFLRDKYGPMTINNYEWGGPREWSGLRTPNSPFYSSDSQHTFGRAADIIFRDVDAETVRKFIFENNWYVQGLWDIGGIELKTSWLHVDVRNFDGIKTFYH